MPRRGGKQWYQAYLRTPHWRAVRAAKLAEVPACEKCGTRTALQVHHLNYDHVGGEVPSDLQVLCDPCHETTHAVKKPKRKATRKRKRGAGKSARIGDPNPTTPRVGKIEEQNDRLRTTLNENKARRERLADLRTWK